MKDKTYKGDVEIFKENQKEWSEKLKGVTKISGYLYVSSNVTLECPKLTSVGGDLYVYSNVTLPKLTSVGGDLSVYSNVTLPKLTSVGGDLSVSSNVTLECPKLTSVGGYLYVYSKISHALEKRLWGKCKKNKWNVCDLQSEWLLSRLAKKKETGYFIQRVGFARELFDKVRNGELSAKEVFAIENAEQRRVAYELMDKAKMKDLADFRVEDEVKDDGRGNKMKVVSFTIQGYDTPFYFLNVICPSTGREYFIETREKTCVAAKEKSFGLENVEWVDEW